MAPTVLRSPSRPWTEKASTSTPSNDQIKARGGSDKVKGGNGNDVLKAGGGDDRANGNDGNDKINSGGGDDVITDTEGRNTIKCGKGDDKVVTNGDSKVDDGCEQVKVKNSP